MIHGVCVASCFASCFALRVSAPLARPDAWGVRLTTRLLRQGDVVTLAIAAPSSWSALRNVDPKPPARTKPCLSWTIRSSAFPSHLAHLDWTCLTWKLGCSLYTSCSLCLYLCVFSPLSIDFSENGKKVTCLDIYIYTEDEEFWMFGFPKDI